MYSQVDLEAGVDKTTRLLQLAHRRQRTFWPGYKPLIDYHDGAYECDFVSPYTKSECNVDAAVMIMLQDWSSDERLEGPLNPHAAKLGHTPQLPTTSTSLPCCVSTFSSR
jgi:hypothetical protein